MNVTSIITKGYEISQIGQFVKTNPIQSQTNPMLARHQCGGTKEKSRHWALKTVKIRHKKESRNKP